jgi:hypothetical protein
MIRRSKKKNCFERESGSVGWWARVEKGELIWKYLYFL